MRTHHVVCRLVSVTFSTKPRLVLVHRHSFHCRRRRLPLARPLSRVLLIPIVVHIYNRISGNPSFPNVSTFTFTSIFFTSCVLLEPESTLDLELELVRISNSDSSSDTISDIFTLTLALAHVHTCACETRASTRVCGGAKSKLDVCAHVHATPRIRIISVTASQICRNHIIT